jgi:hypothetical protein
MPFDAFEGPAYGLVALVVNGYSEGPIAYSPRSTERRTVRPERAAHSGPPVRFATTRCGEPTAPHDRRLCTMIQYPRSFDALVVSMALIGTLLLADPALAQEATPSPSATSGTVVAETPELPEMSETPGMTTAVPTASMVATATAVTEPPPSAAGTEEPPAMAAEPPEVVAPSTAASEGPRQLPSAGADTTDWPLLALLGIVGLVCGVRLLRWVA